MRPRVLHVVLQLDPGGTERLVLDIVDRLRHEIPMAVCCLDGPGAWAPQLVARGVPVFALHRRPGFRPHLAWRLAALARQFDADVLHCHQYSPFVYGRLAAMLVPACRVVYTEHGRLADAQPSRKRRLVNQLLTSGVRDLIAVSHELRAYLSLEGMPARMRVVWNGIDVGPAPTAARRQQAREALGVAPDAFVVLSIARLDPVKDLATLLAAVADAVSRERRLHLVVAGDGPERGRLEAIAAQLGLQPHVTWLGHRDDARAVAVGADVYANSSTSEGISLTLLEAMAGELPIVATRVGGTPEVVDDGVTGRLVPARHPAALADALVAMAADRAAATAIGRAGRARLLADFSLDGMIERYAGIYDPSRAIV